MSSDKQADKEPDCCLDYDILEETDYYLIVNKPPNLPIHPAGIFHDNTLWFLLQEDYPEARIINRLDRDTSGIVLVALSKYAAKIFSRQFSRREVSKEYQVLVHGHFPQTVTADGWLSKDLDSPVHKKRHFTFDEAENSETSITDFKLLSTHGELSLVNAIPETGRTHQIRATLCSLGFPVVGDKIYGLDETIYLRFIDYQLSEEDTKNLVLPHHALHASKLKFKDLQGEQIEVIAPMPAGMSALLSARSK